MRAEYTLLDSLIRVAFDLVTAFRMYHHHGFECPVRK